MKRKQDFKSGVIEAIRRFAASMEADYPLSAGDVDDCLRGALIARTIDRWGAQATVAILRGDADALEGEIRKGTVKP